MNKKEIYPKIKLYFESDEIFFGPGNADFLSLIDSLGSMQAACKKMNMSYSKGWKMIKHMEEKTGTTLVIRNTGGVHGGSSYLSDEAKRLVKAYNKLNNELKKYSEKLRETYEEFL